MTLTIILPKRRICDWCDGAELWPGRAPYGRCNCAAACEHALCPLNEVDDFIAPVVPRFMTP